MAQKAIEGAMVTCRTMHVILSWLSFKFVKILLKFGSCQNHESKSRVGSLFWFKNPEMAQNSNHFCLEFNFSSNFEPSQDFRTKKVSQLGILTRDHCFKPNLKRNSMNPILSHLRITCMFQHVTLAPSMAF